MIHQEREMMLNNQRIPGCEHACWKLEDLGLESRRTAISNNHRYLDLDSKIKTLNLILGNTCNLTCSYCCKEFSHSWLADVINHGGYDIQDTDQRYQPTAMDRIMLRLSQSDQQKTQMGGLILDQISQDLDSIEHVMITGGEPFLYKDLVDIINLFQTQKISIVTGLGVSHQRLLLILEKISTRDISISISGENTGSFHEFNRYGLRYQDFLQNIALIKEYFPVRYHCVFSNLTAFDIERYMDEVVKDSPFSITPVTDPEFMSPWVLDEQSRTILIDQFSRSKWPHINKLVDVLEPQPSQQHRSQISGWIRRFVATRNLDPAIFPGSFLKWLQL
jgi:sulfatase maturation enzyme AslB (radical SAM superfamily)